MLHRCRAVGNAILDIIDPRFELAIFRSRNNCVTATLNQLAGVGETGNICNSFYFFAVPHSTLKRCKLNFDSLVKQEALGVICAIISRRYLFGFLRNHRLKS